MISQDIFLVLQCIDIHIFMVGSGILGLHNQFNKEFPYIYIYIFCRPRSRKAVIYGNAE